MHLYKKNEATYEYTFENRGKHFIVSHLSFFPAV